MAKKPKIEVDEDLMRQMIAGQAPLTSKVVRRIPDDEPEDTQDAPRETPGCRRTIAILGRRV